MPTNASDENPDISTTDVDNDGTNSDADATTVADAVRNLFTYGDTIIVPDRGTVSFTITVDSTNPDYAFTVADADGNLLGDGIITNLDFTIESFHINQQPDTPPKPIPGPEQ